MHVVEKGKKWDSVQCSEERVAELPVGGKQGKGGERVN